MYLSKPSIKASSLALVLTLLLNPLVAIAQTEVKPPNNKYKIEDDLKLGREAAVEAEKQFPVLNDAPATRYLESVGRRLVANIPRQFQQPAFRYSFKIVNARDINAFALPGGPMYVNRGMIEAAKNEGEMAGVMAHEIAHVALRHGTAQMTKMNNPWNQALGIGAIIGGAILGGETGAGIGAALYMGFVVLPYSRDNETQADILGSRILADAGYDPRDLANMFRTIEKESGSGGGPSWLSTHPAPQKRYEVINREASLLEVGADPIKVTEQFLATKERLRSYPRARTLAEIQKDKGGINTPTNNDDHGSAGDDYRTTIERPSAGMRQISNGNWITMKVPDNWRDFPSDRSIEFAPYGAHGSKGITHGMMIGVYKGRGTSLYSDTQAYVEEMTRINPYLRRTSSYENYNLDGKRGYEVKLSGTSPVTFRTELVTIYTAGLRDGDLFYAITVVPESERYLYSGTFRSVMGSIRLYY